MGCVNSDRFDDYIHNGEKIYVIWQLFKHEINDYKYSYSERIQFTYKDIEVIEFYDRDESTWFEVTQLMCNIIDKLGKEKFKIFKKHYDKYTSINERYIVVNNNVYKPYINDTCRSGDLIYYIIRISMEDGGELDGRTNIDQTCMNPYSKEEYNKDQLINRLKYRVKEYYKNKKVLPKDDFLLKKETSEYKEAIKWLEDNGVLSYLTKA